MPRVHMKAFYPKLILVGNKGLEPFTAWFQTSYATPYTNSRCYYVHIVPYRRDS